MKNWTINEFIAECEELSRNRYTYDYSRMPEGICNGHKVAAYDKTWTSVVIDGCIYGLGVINEKFPNGSETYQIGDIGMTALEYVRYKLSK